MTAKAVAVIGDVTPEPVKDPAGTWVPEPITYKAYDHLTIGKLSVIYEASCTFKFISNSTTSKDDETVTLSASASVLQGGQTHVLVNEDFAPGTVAKNKLKVNTSNKLRSG